MVPNPKCIHLSASSIAAFKACPTRFRLAYREGIRSDEDSESQRVGTNWHACHEVYRNTMTAAQAEHSTYDIAGDLAMQAVVDHLNAQYATVPVSKTPEEWETERTILMVSFTAYLWHYSADVLTYISQEIPFDLPLNNPRMRMPLPLEEVVRVGKIDHLVLWNGILGPLERKSTSRDISATGDYWVNTQKDDQVSMYSLASRDMLLQKAMNALHELKMQYPDAAIGNTIYDVWQRPKFKPKDISQKETTAFVASGLYPIEPDGEEGTVTQQEFAVVVVREFDVEVEGKTKKSAEVTVDGVPATVEPGAKGWAIHETVQMFGARLLNEMTNNPERFFQRREIARTDRQLQMFESELYAVYQAMRALERGNIWYSNNRQCESPYKCPFIGICYGIGADAACDGKTTPQGFKRIFVDLTVKETEQE